MKFHIKIEPPKFSLAECRNEREKLFIEALYDRAKVAGWEGDVDAWSQEDRIVLSISFGAKGRVSETRRADFNGEVLAYGYDETLQFATPLDPIRPETQVLRDQDPVALANCVASWFEAGIKDWPKNDAAA